MSRTTEGGPLKILLVSAEVAPFAKVGGLADVAGALPKSLSAMGHDVRVVMPCYRMIETSKSTSVASVLPQFKVPTGQGETRRAYLKRTSIEAGPVSIPVYLIGNAASEA